MDIEDIRRTASASLDPARRSEFGQFFTPVEIAAHMAGLFSPTLSGVRLLDAGAGIGSLLHAAASRMLIDRIDAWEIDPDLLGSLSTTLASCGVPFDVHHSDFILDVGALIASGIKFDRVILNPPYRKVSNSSPHRMAINDLGVRTVNLYTAFIAASLLVLSDGGEIVALVPRSFFNGLYHRPFREFMLSKASIDVIHVFNSRRAAFSDDAVLQENVIIKLTKGRQQGNITVSSCDDGQFTDITEFETPFDRVVIPDDPNIFIRIPLSSETSVATTNFQQLGIEVSTGPIVEYRTRASSIEHDEGVVVVTPKHLSSSGFVHPSALARLNRLSRDPQISKDIWPAGDYVVVKRISSKESKRRIVAYHLRATDFPDGDVSFENHLNVFHSDKSGLDTTLAARLCEYLNSEMADIEFRSISGSTQVNATDLRAISYPRSIVDG
jgi:adenine-specific DNA-methyltransferase